MLAALRLLQCTSNPAQNTALPLNYWGELNIVLARGQNSRKPETYLSPNQG